jgi:hypothetical protein
MRTKTDLELFKQELERSGLRLPGVILCNCEVGPWSSMQMVNIVILCIHEVGTWSSMQMVNPEQNGVTVRYHSGGSMKLNACILIRVHMVFL